MKVSIVLGLAVLCGVSVCGLGCHKRVRVVTQIQAEPPPAAVVTVTGPAPAIVGVVLVGAQMDIRGDIEFDTGAATIRDSIASQLVLSSVLQILQNNPSIQKVRVEGHTDSDGSEASNLVLSQLRSAAVVKWLIDHGVALGRLSSVGCGATDPLVPNTSAENKQRNRRTEFDVEELGGLRPEGYTNPCAPNPLRKP
jgi:outer membrane protein OmpA-like peptidoglycan-associated protein